MEISQDDASVESLLNIIQNEDSEYKQKRSAFDKLEEMSENGELNPKEEYELAHAELSNPSFAKKGQHKRYLEHLEKAANSDIILIYQKDILQAKIGLAECHIGAFLNPEKKPGEYAFFVKEKELKGLKSYGIIPDSNKLAKLLNDVCQYCNDYPDIYSGLNYQYKLIKKNRQQMGESYEKVLTNDFEKAIKSASQVRNLWPKKADEKLTEDKIKKVNDEFEKELGNLKKLYENLKNKFSEENLQNIKKSVSKLKFMESIDESKFLQRYVQEWGYDVREKTEFSYIEEGKKDEFNKLYDSLMKKDKDLNSFYQIINAFKLELKKLESKFISVNEFQDTLEKINSEYSKNLFSDQRIDENALLDNCKELTSKVEKLESTYKYKIIAFILKIYYAIKNLFTEKKSKIGVDGINKLIEDIEKTMLKESRGRESDYGVKALQLT